MSYPDRFIRGIPNNQYIIEGGMLRQDIFYYEGHADRGDGWVERSINWEDDGDAISFSLTQRNPDGTKQFSYGITIIDTEFIRDIRDLPPTQGFLAYERKSQVFNNYHGNILMKAGVSKHLTRLISAQLALQGSKNIIKQDSNHN